MPQALRIQRHKIGPKRSTGHAWRVTRVVEIDPRTDRELPAERVAVTLDPAILAQYRGKYDLGGGFVLTVTTEANRIFTQAAGQEVVEIFPESETKFFMKVADASIEFLKDSHCKVTGLVLFQAGRYEARKIEYGGGLPLTPPRATFDSPQEDCPWYA